MASEALERKVRKTTYFESIHPKKVRSGVRGSNWSAHNNHNRPLVHIINIQSSQPQVFHTAFVSSRGLDLADHMAAIINTEDREAYITIHYFNSDKV